MAIRSYFQAGAFDEEAIRILTDAFETALGLAHIEDRKDVRAEELASRVIILFEKGERDPTKIARRVTAS